MYIKIVYTIIIYSITVFNFDKCLAADDGSMKYTHNILKNIQANIHRDAQDRSFRKLLTILVNDLLRTEPTMNQQAILTCISLSTNRYTYGQCIRSLLDKKISFLEKVRKVRKREVPFNRKLMRTIDKFMINSDIGPVSTKRDNFDVSSTFGDIGRLLTDLVKNSKVNKTWFGSNTVHDKIFPANTVKNDVKDLDFRQGASEITKLVHQLLESPLITLKQTLDVSKDDNLLLDLVKHSISDETTNNKTMRLLSPRVFPMFESKGEEVSFLSPDILALYDNHKNPMHNFSLPHLLHKFNTRDKQPWYDFFQEITGVADSMILLKSMGIIDKLKNSKIDSGLSGIKLPFSAVYNVSEGAKVKDVYNRMSKEQIHDLNSRGYTFMEDHQLDFVYKEQTDKSFMIQNKNLTKEQREVELLKHVLRELGVFKNRRSKRVPAPPCIVAPYVGGTTLTTYLLAPQILCPSVFSYIILGPLVLSPYVLSPYVMGPFILSPMVLTPFILSPYVLSPNILSPYVLSPSILNPIVLSPNILSPLVLSPGVLSPSVLSPNILSPGVLSPTILSDGVLGPAILSPCAMCKKRRRRRSTSRRKRQF